MRQRSKDSIIGSASQYLAMGYSEAYAEAAIWSWAKQIPDSFTIKDVSAIISDIYNQETT